MTKLWDTAAPVRGGPTLGNQRMPEVDRPSNVADVDRVIALISEALDLIDRLARYPGVGARLQEVLDELHEQRRLTGS
jgi:hypothetical protein